MITRQPLEREQRRAADSRAVVVEPAPQQLLLGPEPELADRAVGDGALAEVADARGGFELLVPLCPQLGHATLVSRLREFIGLGRGLGEGRQRSASVRGGGPTYRAAGRIRRPV